MQWQEAIVMLINRALAIGTPLLWATLGEIYTERSGVLNLGVEGVMILGCLSSFAVAQVSGNVALGILTAAVVGGLTALFHAFLSITLGANQYVSGLALAMFGTGLAGLIGRKWVGSPLRTPLETVSLPGLGNIPFIGPAIFSNQCILTYIGIGMTVILWFLLYHTRWGIIIRSVGESPQAADASGINVSLTRYLCTVFGGVMAGIGGAYLSVYYRPAWTEGMTAGMGWIAIALTIFASWNPSLAFVGAIFFGSLYHLSYRLQQFVSPELLKMFPYVGAIVVLVLGTLGKSRRYRGAPASLGMPYKRGIR